MKILHIGKKRYKNLCGFVAKILKRPTKRFEFIGESSSLNSCPIANVLNGAMVDVDCIYHGGKDIEVPKYIGRIIDRVDAFPEGTQVKVIA